LTGIYLSGLIIVPEGQNSILEQLDLHSRSAFPPEAAISMDSNVLCINGEFENYGQEQLLADVQKLMTITKASVDVFLVCTSGDMWAIRVTLDDGVVSKQNIDNAPKEVLVGPVQPKIIFPFERYEIKTFYAQKIVVPHLKLKGQAFVKIYLVHAPLQVHVVNPTEDQPLQNAIIYDTIVVRLKDGSAHLECSRKNMKNRKKGYSFPYLWVTTADWS
jgi:hypothetical protein